MKPYVTAGNKNKSQSIDIKQIEVHSRRLKKNAKNIFNVPEKDSSKTTSLLKSTTSAQLTHKVDHFLKILNYRIPSGNFAIENKTDLRYDNNLRKKVVL